MRRALMALGSAAVLLLTGVPAAAAEPTPTTATAVTTPPTQPSVDDIGDMDTDPATTGSAGIGDSYFPDYGNGGYDVQHYDLRLRYDPATDRLSGTATLLARATQDLSRFDLDFLLDVSSVRVNGWAANYTKAGEHELVITPPRLIMDGQAMTIVVAYSGIPSTVLYHGVSAWTRTVDGALAVGQPEMAWWWFPSNDHPRDKATYDIAVLVPDGLQVVSNGQLISERQELVGWNRWSWRSTTPMATYLAFFVVGRYDMVMDRAPNGQRIINAYSTTLGDRGPAARASVERTAEIIDWASEVFGPYPYEAQGGVAAPEGSISFALETATRPVYGGGFWTAGSNPYVVVHELAHQWYGDSVALADWRDIWLHEGFATYASWMWSETQGDGTAAELFDYNYTMYDKDDPFWQIKPGDPGKDALFDGAVYYRGAMTLHQLRKTVGDQAFMTILRRWASEHAGGNVTTEQFITLAEQVSGRNLRSLFDAWLMTAQRPELVQPSTVALSGKASARSGLQSAARSGESSGIPRSTTGGSRAGTVEQPRSWQQLRQVTDLQVAAARQHQGQR